MKEKHKVIKGAESFSFPGNEIGVLIIHGFIGTPQSMSFLGVKLAQLVYNCRKGIYSIKAAVYLYFHCWPVNGWNVSAYAC